MKRLIQKYDHKFIKSNGDRVYCTIIHIPFKEITDDLDFGDLCVHVMNVLYDNKNDPSLPCHLKITGFDDNSNAIYIELPTWLQDILYVSNKQGIERVETIIGKMLYENNCIKNSLEIGYSNTVGG